MLRAVAGLLILAAVADSARLRANVVTDDCDGKPAGCKKHSKKNVKPDCMANSQIIPGTDCGHVSKIIPKFDKSKMVGKIQGVATNVISTADTAAADAEAAASAAKKAAKLAKAVGGKGPEGAAKGARKAARAAIKAGEDATTASGQLETALDGMKGTDLSDTGPYAMPETKIQKLKKATSKANEKIAAANRAASVAHEEAGRAQKEMLKSAEGALKLISQVVKITQDTIDMGKELRQNASWAVEDVGNLDKSVKELKDSLQKKIDDKEHKDQKPVFQGIYDNLDREMDGAKKAATDLKAQIVPSGDLRSKIKDAKKIVKPLAKTQLEMERTGLPPDNIGKSMTAIGECETAQKALGERMFLVDQGVKSCVKRMKRVMAQVKKAEEFKIDWAAPPATPLGAIGAGKGAGGVEKGMFLFF